MIFPEGRLTVTGGLDEGLRRHRHDRRQGRRDHRSGAHRRTRALAFRLSQPLSGQEGLVPENDRDHPAAGEARRAGEASWQGAPASCGRGAAGHHGGCGGEDRQHQSVAVLGALRSQGDARHGQADRRGSARHEAFLQEADHECAGAWGQAQSRWLRSVQASVSCCRTRPASP